jgi:hypothetical protein
MTGESGGYIGMASLERSRMHGYRIAFLGGLAAGFVLGARAGRERYEQIKQLGQRVAESPAAQQAAGAVQAQATGLAKAARQRVTDGVPKMAATAKSKAADRIPGLRHRNGNSTGHDGGYSSAGGTQEHRVAASGPGGNSGEAGERA